MKNTVGKFLTDWGRELAIVAAGTALGLIVVFFAWDHPQQPANIAKPQKAPDTRLTSPAKIEQPEFQTVKPTRTQNAPDPKIPRATDRPAARAQPPWQLYAAIHSPVVGRRMIAVIIDDMGLDRARTAKAMELAGPLTMSFLTYARNLRAQTATARSAGHELMIHLPMEPEDSSVYAGPKVIKRDLSEDEVQRRLNWAFSRFEGYVGLNNHMGSRYTADSHGMNLVLSEVKRRGLLFIDSRTTGASVVPLVARELSLPFAVRHIFLDDDPKADNITRQLTALEAVAEKQGYGIAIGHPYDTTIAALEKWLPTLGSRGFVLVPVSAIVRHRQQAG